MAATPLQTAAPGRRRRPLAGPDERARAYVAALQRDLNRHLFALGSPTVLAVDGPWDRDTDLAFRRVCRVLGLEAQRNVRTFRAIAGAAAPLTDAEREHARARTARPTRSELRHHFAHAPVPDAEAAEARSRARLHRQRRGVRKAGRALRGRDRARVARHGVPVSLVCAVLEVETGFQNVFGHDSVRNPVKSPPRGLLAVTQDRYKQYLRFRRQGLGNQGVGPMQLTSPGLQDRADALGGCWKVDPNIRVGVEYLAGNIQRLGLYRGVAAYNGSTATPTRSCRWRSKWRAKLGSAARRQSAGGAGPRTLKVRNPRMRGSDVARAAEARQQALRGVEDRRARSTRTASSAPETRKAARRVAYALGAPTADYDRGITPALRSKLRRPSRRTAAELERAQQPPAVAAQAAPPRTAASRRAATTRSACTGRSSARPSTARTRAGTGSPTTRSTSGSPIGTPVIALDDGVIVKTFNSPVRRQTAGWQVTLRSATTPGSTGT